MYDAVVGSDSGSMEYSSMKERKSNKEGLK